MLDTTVKESTALAYIGLGIAEGGVFSTKVQSKNER